MPIYNYECEKCGIITEVLLKLDEMSDTYPCKRCGKKAHKIIVLGHGGIQDEHPRWLNQDVRNALQDESERPITTRSQYNRYLKEKGIIARC